MFERNMSINAHEVINAHLERLQKEQLVAVDATMGNGFDFAFLAGLPAITDLFGFDIQTKAVSSTYTKLTALVRCPKNTRLILASHHLLEDYINKPIDVAMFNLGYLPTGDKALVTHTNTTLEAVRTVIEKLAPGGICTIMTYPGHVEGEKEHLGIGQFFEDYYRKDQSVFKLLLLQTKTPPPTLWVVVNNR